jgi:hypothetical protein
MNNEFTIKRRDDEEASPDRYKTLKNLTSYGGLTVTTDKFITEMPKPKEYIKCTPELIEKLKSMVHFDNKMLFADIFAAGTIPCNNVLFENVDVDDEGNAFSISVQVAVCDDTDAIMASLNGEGDITTIGVIRMFNTYHGTTFRYDMPVRLSYDWTIDWFPFISLSENEFKMINNGEYDNLGLTWLTHLRDTVFLAWYGLQLAMLNPVIKERIHRETVPMDEVKAGNKKKKAKTVKRYVKRITVDDLSDIEIADPKHHNMTKSYWWVTGHWRNQKTKDGHIRKFIKGYWKGPMREIADELGYEPYERKVATE